MTIKDKLLEYSKLKNYNTAQFCKKIGVSGGFFGVKRGITTDVLESILYNCEDLSAEWLLRNEGEMLRSDHHANVHQANVNGNNLNNSTMSDMSDIVRTLTDTNSTLVSTNAKQTEQIGKLIDMIK